MSFLKPYTLKNSYKDKRKNRKSETNIEKSNANVIMMPGKILRPPKLRFFKTRGKWKGYLNFLREFSMLRESSGNGTIATVESEDPGEITHLVREDASPLKLRFEQVQAMKLRQITSPDSQK